MLFFVSLHEKHPICLFPGCLLLPQVVLAGLNVVIPRGELVAVVGPVGCGKSSFCNALLGEMELVSGSVQVSTLPLLLVCRHLIFPLSLLGGR